MAKNVTVDETVEVKELKTPEGNPVEVTEKEGFGKRAWNWTKKNGKKIAFGAISVGAAIGCYALGKRSGRSENSSGPDIIDMDAQEEVFDSDIASDIDVNE